MDVLWGNEKLTNTFSYQKINQLAIDDLEDSNINRGVLNLEKTAIGKGFTLLVDDRNIYKSIHLTSS